jgi:predicted ATP-grasp superfamily ATP-dependent carboligase
MIIPTDDQALTALTKHYDDFKKLICIACPPPRTTVLVLDKSRTLDIARECGIQTPKTKLISHSSQLLECFEDFSFPWIVKPAQKQSSVEDVKSLELKSPDEVRAEFSQDKAFSPPILLQEYCPGAGVGVELLMHEGNCLAAFQHRRVKELPYSGGVSVTAVAEPPSSELLEKCTALLRALEWEGPAMVEFKMHSDDHSAVFMEVNGRYWGTIALPIFAGINFPLYHWQILHGEAIAVPSSYTVGTRWRWIAGHVWRFHDLVLRARTSKSARRELRRSLSEWASPPESSIQDSLFFPSDPMPAVFDFMGVVKLLSLHDAKAVLRRLSTIWMRKNN